MVNRNIPGQSPSGLRATRRTALGLLLGTPLLSGCSTVQNFLGGDSSGSSSEPTPGGPPVQGSVLGEGQVKVGLILPLSAAGSAGQAGMSMRNAAELALSEFRTANIQLLVKDDGATAQGAQQAAQQAVSEGASIILGPVFAQMVAQVAQVARGHNIPVISFSTDSSVAGRDVYLLSFMPESDVRRIVDYSAGIGKRSFAALIPDTAYGSVVEAAFKTTVPQHSGRVAAFEKYGSDRVRPATTVAQALGSADALFIADGGEGVVAITDALTAAGANLSRIQLLGTGQWDDPRIFAAPALRGGLYSAPDPAGFKSFAARYRAKYNTEPVRTATLVYDAVALVAALARAEAAQRFTAEVLTNPSGFTGIDGLFRFRKDGTNERGLAVMKVGAEVGVLVAGSPKSFGG
ncbi:MAG: penicillin-binding protein activator [Alphaproteobacteria bacterium]|nr:penicillin-binding protein activator [Alphaproteobacteria bacterium]